MTTTKEKKKVWFQSANAQVIALGSEVMQKRNKGKEDEDCKPL